MGSLACYGNRHDHLGFVQHYCRCTAFAYCSCQGSPHEPVRCVLSCSELQVLQVQYALALTAHWVVVIVRRVAWSSSVGFAIPLLGDLLWLTPLR